VKIVFLNRYFHPDHSATSQSAAVSRQLLAVSRQPPAASNRNCPLQTP
jgi:hypothetical protein